MADDVKYDARLRIDEDGTVTVANEHGLVARLNPDDSVELAQELEDAFHPWDVARAILAALRPIGNLRPEPELSDDWDWPGTNRED